MPYINVRLTRGPLSADTKREIIRRITSVFVDLLDKDPETTFVVIDQIDPEDWGVGGSTVADRRLARRAGERG